MIKVVCWLFGHDPRTRFELVRTESGSPYYGGYRTYVECARCEARL